MPEYLPLNTLQPPLAVGPPTGPRTGGVLRAAPAVGPRALRPCPLPDRLLRSLRQRVGPKGAAGPHRRSHPLRLHTMPQPARGPPTGPRTGGPWSSGPVLGPRGTVGSVEESVKFH